MYRRQKAHIGSRSERTPDSGKKQNRTKRGRRDVLLARNRLGKEVAERRRSRHLREKRACQKVEGEKGATEGV